MIAKRNCFRKLVLVFFIYAICPGRLEIALAQDTVDVTFRYQAPTTQAWALVGEFTNWGTGALPMNNVGNNTYVKTCRLISTGQPGGFAPGGYEYKFYYPTISGAWPGDPLNPRSDPNQNGNSILYVRNPTIYHLLPNQLSGLVRTANPLVSAYLYPKVGSIVDTGSIALQIDASVYGSLGIFYDSVTQQFRFTVPNVLSNGVHKLWLKAGANTDSATFAVQAGAVQITNIGNFTTLNPIRTLYGIVEDTLIDTVRIVRNNIDTTLTTTHSGLYTIDERLVEGLNVFKAIVRDSAGSQQVSDSVTFNYSVNHAPDAEVLYEDFGSTVLISGAQSTDPDSGQTASLKYLWSSDSSNPQILIGFNGMTSKDVQIPKPTRPGDYIVQLIVTDTTGNKDTTRSLFKILNDGSFRGSSIATVPEWAKNGRIYSFFFKGLTSQGTINSALPFLPYIKAMGFDILWILPIMHVYQGMNNFSGVGYNIVDFENVDPGYGTNDDFRNFVQQAHAIGLKVILDVTPNHTSFQHPFAQEGKSFRLNSPHWSFYQHQTISTTLGDGGVGPQQSDADGFIYYAGFSSQLLNYNWADVDARAYMINVYKSWIQRFGIDGYRFDVYWGPHNRTNNGAGGESEMGVPVRRALKHLKPDIWLLGETAGTGGGTEVNYADHGGGVDAAYDWTLKDAVHNLYSNGYTGYVNSISNGGYFPGPNSSYLRFLENQDEERIVYAYQQYPDTKPPGTVIFTAPGMPMIWEGEELGIGLQVPAGQDRRRAVVNWNQADYNNLRPHYQLLAQIRSQFPAFTTQRMQILSSPSNVFACVRPYAGEPGIVVANFNGTSVGASLQIARTSLDSTLLDNHPYVLSDLYNNTQDTITFVGGNLTLNVNLPAYGSAIYVIADTSRHVNLPTLPIVTSVSRGDQTALTPKEFRLLQNYPNPFNPSTTLSYDLLQSGNTSLKIYNLLGQEVAVLLNIYQQDGRHTIVWDGLDTRGKQASSGVYFARLQQGSQVQVKKLVMLR